MTQGEKDRLAEILYDSIHPNYDRSLLLTTDTRWNFNDGLERALAFPRFRQLMQKRLDDYESN